jgi:lipid-binding SYLF domain-containing protein
MKKLFTIICLCFFINTTFAAARDEVDARISEALKTFELEVPAGFSLSKKATGVLIFPNVVKAGLGIGGEYGEGALMIGGKIVNYFSVASASIGFQLGVQSRSQIILFMNAESLNAFRKSDGWKAGVDASVAVATLGSGGSIDSEVINRPIIGFIFSGKGLMYNLTFEGSKISKINK